MESDRCITIVKNELDKLGLVYKKVEMGEVELLETISEEKIRLIDSSLRNSGLELIDKKDDRLVAKIKESVCQYILLAEEILKENFSEYLRKHVNYDYTSLSNLFSEKEGTTIEKYFIEQRIERAKDLLTNKELTVSEISFKLQFSSVGHLSNQFKKITGLNPSCYRQLWYNRQQTS
jgi:AraC-like DNA-binding protein